MNVSLELDRPIDLTDPERPIVMVDDEELDFICASRFYKRSKLNNPFLRCEDGEVFLQYLAEIKLAGKPMPALVLMDINMPRMNGFEVILKMRDDEFFKAVPIVTMLTSSNDNADRARATEVGANNFLVKPYDPAAYTAFFDSLIT